MLKGLLILLAVGAILLLLRSLITGKVAATTETASSIASGESVLVDVREPAEWESGVIQGAHLLPLSDLKGDRLKWKPFLEANKGRELRLYCRSGNRSGIAARLLADEGFRVLNAGSFSALQSAGQPVTKP
jgi:rhodanese-related sulfurtransferase